MCMLGVVKITCYFEVLLEGECVVVDSCFTKEGTLIKHKSNNYD